MSDPHLDPNDPDALAAATQILDQHELLQHEDNIRSAVKRFIEVTGLAAADELELESSPGEGAKRIDLKTPDLLIEFKKRIGSKPGLDPDPEHVEQLDGYLETSQATGQPQRLGVLTDGKYWLLRWPGAGPVRTQKPYAFTFSSAAQWFALFEWLRDESQAFEHRAISPTDENVRSRLGPGVNEAAASMIEQAVVCLSTSARNRM